MGDPAYRTAVTLVFNDLKISVAEDIECQIANFGVPHSFRSRERQ